MNLLSKYYSVIIVICIHCLGCQKNEPSDIQKDEFYKIFGGAYNDIAVDIISSNSEFYILGNVELSENQNHITIIKTDNFGNRIWEKQYSDISNKNTYSGQIIKLKEKNEFAIIGTIETDSDSLYTDIFYLHINSDGETLHKSTIEYAEGSETGVYIQELENGTFSVGGNTYNNLTEVSQRLFFRINIEGEIPDNLKLNPIQGTNVYNIQKLTDNSNFYAFATGFNSSPDITYINNKGLWVTSIKISDFDGKFYDLHVESENDVYVTGIINNGSFGGQDAFVAKLDIKNFTTSWIVEYGANGNDQGTVLTETGQGNLIMTGSIYDSKLNTSNILVLEVSKTGVIINSKTIGGNNNENGVSIFPSDNDSFVIAATSALENSSFISLIKTKF